MDSIAVAPRQRKTIHEKPLGDLKESIAKKGLFHPIIIRRSGEQNFLVSGERRLRAIHSLHRDNILFNYDGECVTPGEIPYVELTDLDDAAYMEAELEENLLREDLTWQERNAALHAIHERRSQQNPDHTGSDTAKELAAKATPGSPGPKSEGSLRNAIHRAEVIQQFADDPDVQGARTESEAYRIARNKAIAPFLQEMSRREQLKACNACPHTLVHEDFTQVVLEESRFSLIIADPPYGIGADKFGDGYSPSKPGGHTKHTYEDTQEVALHLCRSIIERGYVLGTSNAKLVMFCDVDLFLVLRAMAKDAGWKVWRTPLIWRKGPTALAPLGASGFRREYEMILFAWKGRHPLNALRSDIFDSPTSEKREHAAQKPLALYTEIIRCTCRPGDYVLDPCCGSGTIFPAAFATDTRAIGVEMDENTQLVARARLADVIKNYQRRE
jgi:DNA modification methylase